MVVYYLCSMYVVLDTVGYKVKEKYAINLYKHCQIYYLLYNVISNHIHTRYFIELTFLKS